MASLANGAAEMMGLEPAVTLEDIQASPDYIGAGYGIPTPESLEAISMLARREGILLDPVYTGKAMGLSWRTSVGAAGERATTSSSCTPAERRRFSITTGDLEPMFDTAGKEG